MNYVDIVIGIILLSAAWTGYKKGFIIEVLSLAGLVLAIYGVMHLSDELAFILEDTTELNEQYIPIIAIAAVFIVIVVLVNMVAKSISKLLDMVALGFLNKIAGAIFGLAKAALILSVFLMLARPFTDRLSIIPKDIKDESMLYEPLVQLAPSVLPFVKDSEVWKFLEEELGLEEEGEGELEGEAEIEI
ncbi:CvpA family protein [Sanyastnella coralliicola]|uniref:CvpA family protein n=1 Tax=Sanyastnella coralliicola TaxID=3069118 RepID=UPI0027BABD9D|nr:CvpA family protein [Longitalea sp. SCSIO 12813]